MNHNKVSKAQIIQLVEKLREKYISNNNISGQLKIAPEHTSENVLKSMGKPKQTVFLDFMKIGYDDPCLNEKDKEMLKSININEGEAKNKMNIEE